MKSLSKFGFLLPVLTAIFTVLSLWSVNAARTTLFRCGDTVNDGHFVQSPSLGISTLVADAGPQIAAASDAR